MVARAITLVAIVLASAPARHAAALPDAAAPSGADGGSDGAGSADAGATRGDAAPGAVDGETGDAPGSERTLDVGAAAGVTITGAPPAPVRRPVAAAAPPPVPLRGRVIEKGTKLPLAGASISIDGQPVTESDTNGAFEVGVPPGPHQIQVLLPAHDPIDRRVEARPSAPADLYRLAPRLDGERYETIVRAGHPELPSIAVSADEARNLPGSAGDPMRVLGSLPGVTQVMWPAALYVVRGANPGNTGFFLDGVRVPALFHLALGPSIIHPYLIAGVDFYPGGYPAGYAGFASGIMAARTVAPPADRVHASADVTVYDAGGIMTAPLDAGRGTIAVAARYSYTGALFSLLAEDSVLRYGDYQLRLDHSLAGGQVTAFAFGSLDQLGWLGRTSEPEYASLQYHRLDLRWRRGVSGGRLLTGVTLGVDRSGSTLFQRAIRVRGLSAAPRVVYDGSTGALDIQVGADASAQRFASAVPDFQRRSSDLSRSRSAWSQGLFATLVIHAGRRLTVSPGLRGDLFAEQGVRRFVVEPRLAIVFEATPDLAIKANGGRLAQMPSLPVSVPGFESFGLADLGLQTSLGGSLGAEARLRTGLTLSLTGYYQRLRLTDVRDIDLTSVDPMAPDFLVSRRGRAYGAEVLLRKADQGRTFGWLAYTLSRSLREDDGGVFGRSDWDQRHILNLIAGWRLRGGYSLGARFHYNTGRYAPISGGGGQHMQLPAFYDLDLRAERRFIFDRFLLDAFIDLGNVTLTSEVVQLGMSADSSGRPFVQQQAFRIILPTVGVHGEF